MSYEMQNLEAKPRWYVNTDRKFEINQVEVENSG